MDIRFEQGNYEDACKVRTRVFVEEQGFNEEFDGDGLDSWSPLKNGIKMEKRKRKPFFSMKMKKYVFKNGTNRFLLKK